MMTTSHDWLPSSYRFQIFKTFSSRTGINRAAFFIASELPNPVAADGFCLCEPRFAASDPLERRS
jgi:hypothetical protein